jgi:hypothetical protein
MNGCPQVFWNLLVSPPRQPHLDFAHLAPQSTAIQRAAHHSLPPYSVDPHTQPQLDRSEYSPRSLATRAADQPLPSLRQHPLWIAPRQPRWPRHDPELLKAHFWPARRSPVQLPTRCPPTIPRPHSQPNPPLATLQHAPGLGFSSPRLAPQSRIAFAWKLELPRTQRARLPPLRHDEQLIEIRASGRRPGRIVASSAAPQNLAVRCTRRTAPCQKASALPDLRPPSQPRPAQPLPMAG